LYEKKNCIKKEMKMKINAISVFILMTNSEEKEIGRERKREKERD